jgi:hypothetical protein
MAFAIAEIYWLRMLFQELRLPLTTPPTFWCDNLGALSLDSNPVYHARTKHIEVDYHFTREKVVCKDLTTKYISTLDQIANVFTKGLTTPPFLLLCDKLHVCSTPISLRGDVKTQSALPLAPACPDHTWKDTYVSPSNKHHAQSDHMEKEHSAIGKNTFTYKESQSVS